MQSTISQICKYRADSEITSPRQEHYISLAIETSHRETGPQRSTPTGNLEYGSQIDSDYNRRSA